MPAILDDTSVEGLTPVEKEVRLNEITDRYLRGEVEVEDFLQAQRDFGPDFEAAFKEIATRRYARNLASHPPVHRERASDQPSLRFRDVLKRFFAIKRHGSLPREKSPFGSSS